MYPGIAVRSMPHRYGNSRTMGSHGVTCHLTEEVTFPPLLQPIKAGTWFSDPEGIQGLADLYGLIT